MNFKKLKLSKPLLIWYLVVGMTAAISVPAFTYVLKPLTNSITNEQPNEVLRYLIIMVVLILIMVFALVYRMIMRQKVMNNFEERMKKRILKTQKDHQFNSKEISSQINNYIFNTQILIQKYFLMSLEIMMDAVAIIGSAVVMLIFSPALAAAIIGLNSAAVIATQLLAKKQGKLTKKYSDIRTNFVTESSDFFNGFNEFLTFSNRENTVNRFKAMNKRMLRKQSLLLARDSVLNGWISSVSLVAITTAIFLIAIFTGESLISAATLVPFISINSWLSNSLTRAFDRQKQIRSNKSLLDKFKIPESNVTSGPNKTHLFPITIRDLKVITPKKKIEYPPVLKFKRHDKILITGGNGRGKSILIRTVFGLYSNYEGEITISDVNLHKYTSLDLVDEVIFLNDKPMIFPGNLLDNLFIETEKEYDVIDQKFGFITQNFKSCYQDARSLSLGQKQLLAFLRVYTLSKKTIIVDEGLSAVSGTNSQLIDNYLSETDKTVFYISHKKTHFKFTKHIAL